MKKTTALLFLLSALLLSHAQDNVLLKGYVLDKDSKAPLGLAAVQIKNSQLGSLTDDSGYFELPIPKTNLQDSLKVSFVGYKITAISIKNYQSSDTLTILVENAAETKPEAVIVAVSARGVMIKAIDSMRRNFYLDSLIETGLYRQYHKENGKFVRLIEADVSVAFNCKSVYNYSFHEMIQVNKERRSENYETNGDQHGDHLVDLLQENPYSYNRGNFMNPRFIDRYAPKFVSEDSAEYVIALQYKERTSDKLVNAKVWIEKGTYAMTRMEIEKFPNPYYTPSKYAYISRWKLVNEVDVITTKKVNGKYMLGSMERVYNHHVLNRQTGQVDYVVEEAFDLYFDDFETDNVGTRIAAGKYSEFSDLYLRKYGYDKNFWDDYDLVDEHPLPPGVKQDLEHAKPLETQFKEAGL